MVAETEVSVENRSGAAFRAVFALRLRSQSRFDAMLERNEEDFGGSCLGNHRSARWPLRSAWLSFIAAKIPALDALRATPAEFLENNELMESAPGAAEMHPSSSFMSLVV